MGKPSDIPFPLSSFPGLNPQEGAGRLINAFAVPLGEPSKPTAPAPQKWMGSSGLSQFAITVQTNYRGGLIVKNLSYEVFESSVITLDAAGTVNVLGPILGTKKVSIARNQAAAPDVVAVDVDNGAFKLSGGGAPVSYNGGGNLPQPNSVSNQDGYFFFTIADSRVFASGLNALTQNALTFITIQGRADVTLLRGIPFSGLMLFFTTGHFEAWQDAANVAPAFPYSRASIIDYGLIQFGAIAGYEVGFSELLWVAQDFGVYWMSPGSLSPIKVSPSDLDRLIEAQVKAGNILEAGVHSEGGYKFWRLDSPAWSWEFNITTKKWCERQSLKNGLYTRTRATCGHPAFNKWLCGDQASGNILFHDDTNFTENGAPFLYRIESGPVRNFPQEQAIARADIDFVMGVGQAVGNYRMVVLGASAGTGGVVRLTVDQTSQARTGDNVKVENVLGTTEANGVYPMTVVDVNHIELQGVPFVHAYVSGGTATDITAPVGAISPTCAISISKDGGASFDNPSLRSLAPQGKSLRSRATIKNRGQAGPAGVRVRVDITDPVYRSVMGGTISSDPREVTP
ncbi:MAG: hypothetical protein PS018_20295 [bacterium]|nr:hypothetical protein [bacterium]